MRSVRFVFAFTLALATATPALAQITIPGAGEDKFGLVAAGRAIWVTTAETKVGFSWTNDPKLTSANDCRGISYGTPEYRACLLKSVDTSLTLYEVNAAITGEKGQRTFFSEGGFTPGVEVGALVKRRSEKTGAGTTGGFTDYYAGVTASTKPLSVATFSPTGVSGLDGAAEKRVGATAGVNVFIRENFGIGFGGSGARVWSSTGVQKPSMLCTTTNAGLDQDGKPVHASKCEEGYIGPLSDQSIGSFRVELLRNFTRVKTNDQGVAEATATIGIIASANVALRSGASATYNFAAGPTLHPKGVPHKVILAVLFGVNDITDSGHQDKTFRNKFSARLFFGIPVTGF